jgi:alkylation response protein AidB-like acyl-CoA dehydrogenase
VSAAPGRAGPRAAPAAAPTPAAGDPASLRSRYRAWLEEHVPRGWRSRVEAGGRDAAVALGRAWMRELDDGGWAAPSWPVEHGGMAATIAEQVVMFEENARADAPSTALSSIALNHAGATLLAHGTDAQRSRHLERIRRGEEIWCQGFSEPGAGSDLAALRTRAVRDGDHYVVTGQKVWSSLATHADWCLLLARTDPDAPKRRGISYLLLDLASPGVEVRPLRQISGAAEFCEIFLDEVRVPVSDRIGAEHEGWKISQTTLAAERGPFFLPAIHALRGQARDALRALPGAAPAGVPAAADPALRQELVRDYAEIEILAELYQGVLAGQQVGQAGPEASLVKLHYSELLVRLTGHAVEALGLPAQLGEPLTADDDRGGTWMLEHLGSWGMTIGGGTSEIQRNLIAERVLGLPREPGLT